MKIRRKLHHLKTRMCLECGKATASFGIPDEVDPTTGRKLQWCSACAKAHDGAVNINQLNQAKCEVCNEKNANFGLLAENRKRWCAGCGRPRGAVSLRVEKPKNPKLCEDKSKLCEDCQEKPATFVDKPGQKKRRWCHGCSKASATLARRMRAMAPIPSQCPRKIGSEVGVWFMTRRTTAQCQESESEGNAKGATPKLPTTGFQRKAGSGSAPAVPRTQVTARP